VDWVQWGQPQLHLQLRPGGRLSNESIWNSNAWWSDQISSEIYFWLLFNRPTIPEFLPVMPYNNCDSTTIRLWSDYDISHAPASILHQQNLNIFRRSHVIVVSQSSRTQIVISITSVVVECVVVSSYRSRVVVESQLWYRLEGSPPKLTFRNCWRTFYRPDVLADNQLTATKHWRDNNANSS